jgi:hypothetical protein
MDIISALWLVALWFTFWIGFALGAWWTQVNLDAHNEER